MSTAISHDIQVTVRARFDAAHSDPRAGRFVFGYRVTLVNTGRGTVQLLRRQWTITDSLASEREVEGPGVVGQTPVLLPGGSFTYSSACDLRSGLGRMEGSYLMRRMDDGSMFRVRIPPFLLCWPALEN
ncbi:MAG: Co2+/Mg2+ efflux protein ApaG [Flavobacteriales bacterium]|nr:Co2+/Mg2+ efflux protein ApaG [Flavobacteriales bacterium]